MWIIYPSSVLWGTFQTFRKPCVDLTTWITLKSLGIAKLVPRRGCRAGSNKPRNLQVIQGYGKYGSSSYNMDCSLNFSSIIGNYLNWPYMQLPPYSLLHGQQGNNTFSNPLDCLIFGRPDKLTLVNIRTATVLQTPAKLTNFALLNTRSLCNKTLQVKDLCSWKWYRFACNNRDMASSSKFTYYSWTLPYWIYVAECS